MYLRNVFKRIFLTTGVGDIFLEMFGGLALNRGLLTVLNTVTYGVAPIINAALGNDFVVTVTDAVAFVFGVPTNPPPTGFDQVIRLTIRNTSGGAHGAGTFNAIFKTSAAVPAIATANSRTFAFRWDGTNWVEIWRTAADVAN